MKVAHPQQISCGHFYLDLPTVTAQKRKCAGLARRAYRFAKQCKWVRFIDPPMDGLGGVKVLRCKQPKRGVKVRALSQYVVYHPPANSDGWMLRVDIFGFKS